MQYLRARARSFGCAAAGILGLLRAEPHARLHLAATLSVVAAAFWLRLRLFEWCWLIAAIGAVWAAEAMNTALELLADALCPDHHPLIGQAKDAAAGAVLVTAVTALGIALCVFVPHLVQVPLVHAHS
jgi:diacylglycerol kinase